MALLRILVIIPLTICLFAGSFLAYVRAGGVGLLIFVAVAVAVAAVLQGLGRLATVCPNARVGDEPEMAHQWPELSESEWLTLASSERQVPQALVEAESVW